MIRFLLLVILVISAGCAPRFDVFATWTIDRIPAADACQALRAPQVRFRVLSRENDKADAVEEITTAPCRDGQAVVNVGAFADIFVDLVDGETFGTAGPFELAPITNAYEGKDQTDPLGIDIDVERGRMRAELRVLGRTCEEAGASTFNVTLRRNTGPLGVEVILQDQTVSCRGGNALFEPDLTVEKGSRYEVIATTTIDGENFATPEVGEGFVPQFLFNVVTVDLQGAT